MEKLLYPLWKADAMDADSFRDALLGSLCVSLQDAPEVRGLRLAVADSAVAAASGRRMQTRAPLPDALLSLWVDFAAAAAPLELLIDEHAERRGCYLVCEAEPLSTQQSHPCAPGERVHGMCQVVFMTPPEGLGREDWLSLWKDSHTGVAIDTQSTFGYRQNLVVQTRGEHSLDCHAIVEEHFPPEAMADDHAFYASGGDEATLKKHMTAMMESCARFIDFSKIDVIPMSEYRIKPLRED
tara:strand:+ start:26391 stop:27110 length:720 start_codon:yes stop_codon:yes gene_type:complete